MQFFSHEGFDLAFLDRAAGTGRRRAGAADPRLCLDATIVNWVSPGWFKTLNDAGYRAIAFDNRGHGASSKSYDRPTTRRKRWRATRQRLLDHLGIERAHVMGYSMGARISAFLALAEPATRWRRWSSAVWASAWSTASATGIRSPQHCWPTIPRPSRIRAARSFRAFADQTKSDRRALAACIVDVARAAERGRRRADRAADADCGRHQGRHRRLGGRTGRADAERRKLCTSRAATTCWPSATRRSSNGCLNFMPKIRFEPWSTFSSPIWR